MRNSLSRQHQRSHALPVTARRMEPDSGSRLAKPLTLAAMSLGYGVVQLDVTIVNTALNSIGNSLGGGVSELQWVVSAYTVIFAALILTAGALGDRVGAKNIFMLGLRYLHRCITELRASAHVGHTDRRACGAGRGRGNPRTKLACAPQSCLSNR
jgi:hypothetical protein